MNTEPASAPGLDWRTLNLAGKSAIEASAGTGKTYTLVLLVLRLLLERELPPSAILLATFTEAATLELRARVMERVKLAHFAALKPSDPKRKASKQSPMAAEDPLAQYLNTRWQNDSQRLKTSVRLRDEKILERAILQMDDMPIRTLHGFCRQLLSSFDLVPGNLESDVEDGDALTEAALDDAFRRRFTDVKALPEAQRDALDAPFLDALRAGIKRVLKYGRISLRPAISVDAQRYAKARMALFRSQYCNALAAVLAQASDELYLRAGARRALENLLRVLKQGAQRQLPKASLALFAKPELTQFKKARRSILENPAMAQLCHFAQLHQFAVRGEFATLLNSLVDEVRLSRGIALAVRGGVSFDSMIEQLAERLAPSHDAAAGEFASRAAAHFANAIHQRYPVALIDEFQDTDAQQWAILQAIYGARGGLILVGDPKQSIYRFRGSDVHTYVRATKACDRYFLQHNFRAGAQLVAALNGFYGAVAQPFHSAEIRYRAAQVGRANGMAITPTLDHPRELNKPLSFIEVSDPEKRYSPIDACLRTACSDIKKLTQAYREQTASPSIALLVSSNRHVRMAQDYLLELGVHASASASLGVYQSEAAQVLQCVLCALAAPSDLMRARAARLALRLDSLERVCALDARALFRWVERYLAQLLARGISFVCLSLVIERERDTAFDTQFADKQFADNQFADIQFSRDANHLAELLALDEQALLDAQPGLRQNSTNYAQMMWQNLSAHIDQPERNADSTERRRIAAGARVQVMTVHKAKGLEFDLVFLPTLCVANASSTTVAIVPGAQGLECDAGSDDFENAIAIEADEAIAELLRLQYVALTRAKQAVNVYFSAAALKDKSALGWHLAQIAANQRTEQVTELTAEPAWEEQINAAPERVELASKPWHAGLERLREHENIGFSARELAEFEPLPPLVSKPSAKHMPAQVPPLPALRPIQRRISFSSLTQTEAKIVAVDADALVESEWLPPTPELIAEIVSAAFDSTLVDIAAVDVQSEIVALEKLRGPNFGLALHALFEDALTPSTDLADVAMAKPLNAEQVTLRLSQFGFAPELESANAILALILRNRSTEVLPAVCMANLDARNCVAELAFQLPVRGLDYCALAELGPRFGLPSLFLPEQALDRVNGLLTGFIDLIFQADGRFYLLDYKSNWLGASLQDYCGSALDAAMARHHYHLQHLLYALALHRYLQQSLPDYDFDTHFGGAHYLFVRAFGLAQPGMSNAGHFKYRAPKALIEALDRMFSGLT